MLKEIVSISLLLSSLSLTSNGLSISNIANVYGNGIMEDSQKYIDYSNYKVIRCEMDSLKNTVDGHRLMDHLSNKHSLEYYRKQQQQQQFDIENEEERDGEIDIWTKNENFIDLRVSQSFRVPEFCETIIGNIQELIDTQNDNYNTADTDTGTDTDITAIISEDSTDITAKVRDPFFDSYQDLDSVYAWMEMICLKFPTLASLELVGQTFEGREMKALHISTQTNGSSGIDSHDNKKTIVLTGGVHAREWVSVSSVLFIASELLNRFGLYKRETRFLENLDFFIIPVFNPDGYSYTWTHDRLWRKNRQQTYWPKCFGIDIDHSFDFQWTGTTNYPCSEDYSGEAPFEAVEAESWNNFLIDKKGDSFKLHGYLDFHSYSQEVLYPYAYSCDALPRDIENLLELSYGLAKAIRNKSGRRYNVLSSCQDKGSDFTPGLGSGSALDYMYHHRAHWAFQLKLRDTGNHGFLLPSKFIRPVGKESYAAVKYFCDFILNPDL